jgi:hypothetical protein
MPRFLLITILILVLAGHIFSVSDYTPKEEEKDAIYLEDIYFDKKYENYGPIEVIESPALEDKVESMYINNGEDCIFFDEEGIPWLENCPVQIIQMNE